MSDLSGTARAHFVLVGSLLSMMVGLGLFLHLRQPRAGTGRGAAVAPLAQTGRPESSSNVPVPELVRQQREELPALDEVHRDPGARTAEVAVLADASREEYELFRDWGPYERATLLRHRLRKVTLGQYEKKWATGDHEPVEEGSNLKDLVEDETGRPLPNSMRYGPDGTRLVTLSEEEAPEAWAIMAAIRENNERIREYEEELEKLAAAQGSQGE